MTTLAIALAQSPIRAASVVSARQPDTIIEVRALLTERHERGQGAGRQGGQATWTQAWRYELLCNGVPTVTGSYREITEMAAHLPGLLDWQPLYERASTPTTTTTTSQPATRHERHERRVWH